jgi:hypothetical protein
MVPLKHKLLSKNDTNESEMDMDEGLVMKKNKSQDPWFNECFDQSLDDHNVLCLQSLDGKCLESNLC